MLVHAMPLQSTFRVKNYILQVGNRPCLPTDDSAFAHLNSCVRTYPPVLTSSKPLRLRQHRACSRSFSSTLFQRYGVDNGLSLHTFKPCNYHIHLEESIITGNCRLSRSDAIRLKKWSFPFSASSKPSSIFMCR